MGVKTSLNGRRLCITCTFVRSGDVACKRITSNVSDCGPKGAGRTLRHLGGGISVREGTNRGVDYRPTPPVTLAILPLRR
jgi:hypothetical protein